VRVRDRYAALSKNGTVSRADYDQAVAGADAALARVNSAKQSVAVAEADIAVADAQIADIDLKLARTKVKAPVSGIVSAKNIKVGAIASASADPLFTIIEDGALELRAEVAEGDLQKVTSGQTVSVRLPGQREPITGTVRLVDPTVDLTSRLGTVRISFDRPDRIRAGMFASAAILVEKKPAVVVPISAVSMSADEATVLKVADGRVKITPVVTGITDGGVIEIIDGLSAGDSVVAKAGAFVRDGDRIHPVPLAETSTESAAVTVGD
jgi:HlyD family secretion protein